MLDFFDSIVSTSNIHLWISDSEDHNKEISLKKIIYSPEYPKNLISITRWIKDKTQSCQQTKESGKILVRSLQIKIGSSSV